MGKNKNQRNYNANRRLAIKLFVIGLIVAVVIGGWQIYLAYTAQDEIVKRLSKSLESMSIEERNDQLIDGEIGDTFTDLHAGFTIKKPDEKWHFIKDVPSYRENELGLSTTPAHIGSVIIKNPQFASITVAVQQGEMPAGLEFTIDNWFDYALYSLSNSMGFEFEIIDRYASPENDYGYSVVVVKNSEERQFQYEAIRKYDDKVFLFHISSELPEKLPVEIINDIEYIFNSYTILP